MNIYRQASASTYEALTLPAKLRSQYDEFIIKNSSAVSQIESALRSLTYIIPGTSYLQSATSRADRPPGRFRDAEIASESRTPPSYDAPTD